MEFDIQQKEIADIFRWHEERRIQEMRDKQAKYKEEIKKEWYFLTINPAPNKKLPDFLKTIQKAVNKKWISYYVYVIEQRGENIEELGKGFHTHIIFNKGIKHCKVVKEMANSFKNMCDVSNFHLFNLKNIGDEEKKRKIEYITGIKADTEKHLKQQMDIIFREKEKLKSYYILESSIDASPTSQNDS